ncbi:MAG TPA: polymer-forming cytoskeletal protein, partial [Acetobacteraceae bacterium]|nr:polymer-forming cytoskeletal protein [Acetobacteraceae bacterium]
MSRPPFPATPGTQPATPGAAAARPWIAPARPAARDPGERRTLVVGRGISVQGTVQDAERLVVEGTVEATMIHATELSIAPG